MTEGFFRAIVKHSSDMVAIVNQEGNYFFVSESVRETLGYEPEELMGNNLFDYLQPTDHLYAMSLLEKVLLGEQVNHIQIKFPEKNGSWKWLDVTLTNMLDNDDVKGVVINSRDITEQKQASEELEKLSLVASKSSSGILILDKEGRIEWVNDSFVKTTGFTPIEVIGKLHGEVLFGADTNKDTVERIRSNFYNNLGFSEEIIQYKKNGEPFWTSMDGTPVFDHNGNLSKYVSIESDISVRKLEKQELVMAKEQAEQAAKAKTQFLSVMSHEIRTPMNAVIGFTHLLMEKNPRADQLEHLKVLQFSAQNLLVLINDILDFNKIEAGKIDFENIEMDLKVLIGNVRAGLLQKAKEKNIEIKLMVDQDLPHVKGDPVRVSQVLTNLVSNSVKFTDEGRVTVLVEVKKCDDNFVTVDFEVRDTGIGIPEDKQQTIFETFTQANSDTTRKFGGTGLGLTITKRLLQLMHSDISVESTFGKGSTFSFSLTFPVSKSTVVSAPAPAKVVNEKNLAGVRLLVAEDNEINVLLIKCFLDQWKVEFDVATTGAKAVEMVIENDYDIVIMDLQMPELDGYEAAATIRALPHDRYKELPIIALTASATFEIRDKAFDAGMNDYVSKPFNPEELYKTIQKYTQCSDKTSLRVNNEHGYLV